MKNTRQANSLPALAAKIPTEAAAYEYLEGLRWNGTPVCPHCGVSGGHYFLKPRNGVSRETRSGNQSERRMWKCKDCRKQFSVTTGTVMHGSHVALRTWLFVFFEMASSKNGVAAREIERKYGVNPRTAWHLTQRIREAMANDKSDLFAGNVVADETYIGGSEHNRHASKKGAGPVKGRALTSNVPVVTVIDADNGIAHSEVTKGADAFTLGQVIRRSTDIVTATLHTDMWRGYKTIGSKMAGHFTVDHSKGQYVTDKSHGTNKAENFFSQLKRSLDGTHHQVSPKHLSRYLVEFDYRYSTRGESDHDRMAAIVRQSAGTYLSYDALRGRSTL